jgi:hypothetical protein
MESTISIGTPSSRTTAGPPGVMIGDSQNDVMSLELALSMMRFATAACGIEMIESAGNMSDLVTDRQAIAFDTGIPPNDVKLLKDGITTKSFRLLCDTLCRIDHGHQGDQLYWHFEGR